MKHRILSLLAIIMCAAAQVMAQTATPDSIFVVKNGIIVNAYEVGKDVDNISFPHQSNLTGNVVKIGNNTIELKSAIVRQVNNVVYAYISTAENVTTMAQLTQHNYLSVIMSADMLGQEITMSTFDKQFGVDADGNETENLFIVSYVDVKQQQQNPENYEPVTVSSYDWDEKFLDGNLQMSYADGKLNVTFDTDPKEEGNLFAAQYNSGYTFMEENPYHFTVDDYRSDLRAAFAEKTGAGIAFYLTSGNIDNANDLENCHYYARLFVPTRLMDGKDIKIDGSEEYELTFVDNKTDVNNPITINLSTANYGKATGYVSVLDRGDGSYTVIIDVKNMGPKADRSLSALYRGTPAKYDLSIPSTYTIGSGEAVTLKSAGVSHADGIYTIYLSSKAGINTLAGMADADIVVTMPDAFVNDNSVHGFSGTDTNAKISIKYAGDTYNQKTTSTALLPIAMGGNAKVTIDGNKVNLDFTVFGIEKYKKGTLKGHFEGNATLF